MAIIKTVDGRPLFSKAREALDYGKKNNLEGYHLHRYSVGPNMYRTGYMAGETHEAVLNLNLTSSASNSGSSSGGGY